LIKSTRHHLLPLETTRLFLRDLKADDFGPFFAFSQDPEHSQFYAEEETSAEFVRRLFDRLLLDTDRQERIKYQLAICLASGELIGTCGVRLEDGQHRQASFGCAIARAYWGQGYAHEASRKIIDFGFTHLPIHRLYAETLSENRRARKLAEQLGLRQEGELREHKYFKGRWWNTLIYAVLKSEWQR
jgi:[ribosomal protein S5]-alanine N-acetyltransferase